MACACGHAPEEHREESRECEGTFLDRGKEHPCQCAMYEEADDDDA
jgi:hypothetical protein